jgi:type IV pilus assembly protein PilY1
MKLTHLKWFLLLCLALTRLPAFADDTDLFAWANKSTTGSANVLFVIDNGANFSSSVSLNCSITTAGVVDTSGSGSTPTNFDGAAAAVEQCALYSVLKSLTTTSSVTLNIGVMMFNSTGQKSYNLLANTFTGAAADTVASDCSSGGTGGCLVIPMTGFTATAQTNLLKWIRSWNGGNANKIACWTGTTSDCGVKSNNTANGASMQEAWAYYAGKQGVSGRSYSSIKPTGGCGNNYVIFIGNAYRNNSAPGDSTNISNSPYMPLVGTGYTNENANPVATSTEQAVITGTLATTCPSGSSITLQTAEGKGVYALNWARYMKDNGVAKTYSIGILGSTCNPEYAAHLQKLGALDVGGGKFYATNNYADLVVALNQVLTEVLSVNSVFSSVSLPASVNTQGEYLNQIFIGMFRPDDTFAPRWVGNLKQYQAGYFNGVLQTLDADGGQAINSNTGFITACARSYWTPTTVDSYWANYDKKGTCTTIANSTYSNYPDGDMVEKGSHAYKLRSITPANRVMKTCGSTMSTCTALTTFNTTNVSWSQLGLASAAATSPSATDLVSWIGGTNLLNELSLGTTVMRPSSHGDVVHSRPAAVNHGTNNTTDLQVVVYYGGNDGVLRAVNGNQSLSFTSNSTVYAPGQELWSFMPPEFYGSIKRLYDNSPAIKFPNDGVSTATAKSYGVDGAVTPLKTTVSSVSKTYIYATMRRGGRAVYAFDVTTPGNPSLLWKKGCASSSLTDSDCSSSMSDMGQSWSQIKTFYASNYSSGSSALIIMGGGYDTCEDYDGGSGGANHNCTSSSKGHKVYILDAVTGAVVRSFDTVAPSGGTARGVVADAAIINSSGLATYAYIPDLGGNVYRISFSGTSSSDWSMTRIATVGCGTVASCTANRKFMFTPSVVPVESGTYYYVLLGSGDREKPVTAYTASNNVSNYFFMIKDKPADSSWLTGESSNCSSTSVICLSSLTHIGTTTPTDATLATTKGWYMDLSSTEQVVTSAATYSGQTFFSTHQPASQSANSCSTNLGTAQAYCVGYKNAAGCFASTTSNPSGRISKITAGGLAPSPVVVTANISTYDYGTHSYITGAGGSTSKDVAICVGCAMGSDGIAGGSGTNTAGETGGESTGGLNSTSTTTYHKSRLYWFLQK